MQYIHVYDFTEGNYVHYFLFHLPMLVSHLPVKKCFGFVYFDVVYSSSVFSVLRMSHPASWE